MLSCERIAKLPRYCRNYAHETQKCPAKDGGARIICAMDGAYTPVSSSIETLKSIISYRILAAKRSERESTRRYSTLGPGTCAPSTQKKFIKIYWFSVGSSVSDSLSCSTAGSTYVYVFSDFLKMVSLDPTWHTVISSPSLMSSLLIASTPAER
mgnify:FL=1